MDVGGCGWVIGKWEGSNSNSTRKGGLLRDLRLATSPAL